MNETTENFLNFWENFKWPESKPVFYRAYYRDDTTVFFSMEDLPGNYIEIDLETYQQGDTSVRVIDGKLVKVTPLTYITKLQPTSDSGYPCHPQDVSIIVNESSPHQKWAPMSKNYDS